MEANWFSVALAVLFWVICMDRMMRWHGHSRVGPSQIVQPFGLLVVGFLCFQFSAGVIIIANALPNCTVTIWTDLGFAGFACASLGLVASYFNSRHEVDDGGMRFGRASGRHGSFLWRDVDHIGFSELRSAYRITLRSGITVGVHQASLGLAEFANCVLRNVPSTRIAPATRALLANAADGHVVAS